MSSVCSRGCLGCRKFPQLCSDGPFGAPQSCADYENFGEWCLLQAAWLDKAQRDWHAGLGAFALVVTAGALLSAIT